MYERIQDPMFGNTQIRTHLKAKLMSLDDDQSISVPCKERDTWFTFQSLQPGWGLALRPTLWIPLEGQAWGWSQDKQRVLPRRAGTLPAAPAAPSHPLCQVTEGPVRGEPVTLSWLDAGTQMTAWVTDMDGDSVQSHSSGTFEVLDPVTWADVKPALCPRAADWPEFWGQGIQVLLSKVYWT